MNGSPASALYVGTVTHRRNTGAKRRFRYRSYSFLLDLDELDRLASSLWLFSRNRWNLFSFHDRDHGPRDGTPLRRWVDETLASAGIDLGGGPVQVLAFPRVLGYVFDPLTVYFARHHDGRLAAVLYEVHNTFGHAHTYVALVGEAEAPLRHDFAKQLHVSPFFDIAGRYLVRLGVPGDRFSIAIDYEVDDDRLFTASMSLTRRPLTSRELARVFLTHPLLTIKVIMGIHWQAFKIWRDGATYRPIPEPPERAVTMVRSPVPS